MNCLRYWARYVRKREVKGGGIKNGNESASQILLLDSPFRIITISIGEYGLSTKKGVLSGGALGALGLNTLCKGCSSHTTLVGLLYPREDKLEKVYIDFKVQTTKGLNLLKESECRASVQIVLCNFFLYVNNLQKYYSVSRCVISIIIVFAPTASICDWLEVFLSIHIYSCKKIPSILA